ncbi:MAG TPA: SIS domain-containing protein [Mycobacteriales bacterium]
MTRTAAGVDLDDVDAVEAADPGQMLRAIASSAAQVREAVTRTADAGLDRLGAERPRAIVTAGMGGSGIAGDVLAAATGPSCPVPVLTHRAPGLPGWVGVADVVCAVSCSGATAETLSAAEEAVRRGARVLGVGAANSPLADIVARGHGPYVVVPGGRMPRASLWALAIPLVLAADRLGVLGEPVAADATADRLEQIAERCHPARDALVNPGKELAHVLAGALTVTWGATPLTGVAAYRFACDLNENAKLPAVHGVLPEAAHNQIVAYDGPFAPGAADIFADPDLDDPAARAMHQVLLREPGQESAAAARTADAITQLAPDRGIRVTQLSAEGTSRLERLASLVGLLDYVSVYAALVGGVDPTPIDPISALKATAAS